MVTPPNLNPTLWRTCRMLSGTTRLRLLRAMHAQPGQNVSQLARALNLGLSAASQDLRRIQSRGLLRAEHRGLALIYRFGADPQVRSTAPLLKALTTTLATRSPDQDAVMQAIAFSFAHPKRIAILKSLLQSPKSVYALQKEIRTSFCNLQRHLRIILAGGLARRDHRVFRFVPPAHPLAKALVRQLRA